MLYTNDDLNNLFKKAGKYYPLKTDSSNWDDVAAKLNKSTSESSASKSSKVLKYIMVIFLAGGSLIFYKFKSASDFDQSERKKNNNKTFANDTQKNSPSYSNTTKPSMANVQFTNPVQSHVEKGKSGQSVYTFNLTPVNRLSSIALVKEPPQSASLDNERSLSSNESLKLSSSEKQENEISNVSQDEKEELENPDNNSLSKINQADELNETADATIRLNQSRNYRIYGTFFGGPEFSTVKFQRLDKPGYKIGVSLGYRINKSVSLEVGLQREHLNFYSSGDYLDTTLLRIKPNTDIEDVTVSSKLTSVPVSLRYNFASKSKGHFYASAGINAVIITHSEQYQYSISKDGVPANISRSYSALTSSKYFSGVNFSAGFERDLSKCWSVKIESYYQTPVNNLGVGKLPVTSFGINVGITKNLK